MEAALPVMSSLGVVRKKEKGGGYQLIQRTHKQPFPGVVPAFSAGFIPRAYCRETGEPLAWASTSSPSEWDV